MRNMLALAAIVVFVVSTGLLEMARSHPRSLADLPPAMGDFGKAKVDAALTGAVR